MNKSKRILVVMACALAASMLLPSAGSADNGNLYKQFVTPPQSARPQVWWHWMNGNITKDGIRKDIEWMHRAGIGGFHCFDAGLATPQVVKKRLEYMTPEWKDAFSLAVSLADSLNMDVIVPSAPGWSNTGGPWVNKEDAMKKITWRSMIVNGNGKTMTTRLPEPYDIIGRFQNIADWNPSVPANHFYKDIAVLAVKLPDSYKTLAEMQPKVSSSGKFTLQQLTDGDLGSFYNLPADAASGTAWVDYEFTNPVTFRSISVADNFQRSTWSVDAPPVAKRLEASDNGKDYRAVCDIPSGNALQQTITFPETTAKHFRIVYPNAKNNVRLSECVLYTQERVNHAEEKAGFASTVDANKYPTPPCTDAIDTANVLDVSKYASNGVLKWNAPKGKWLILRMGYSLTGKQNHPASPEATGLEVDKMDSAAVYRYITKYLDMYDDASNGMIGKKGIKSILVDSYEAGAENWTPAMEQEFEKRRGYSMRKFLPAITGIIIGSSEQTDKFLWDYRMTMGQLVTDNLYGQLGRMLHKRGMSLYSESQESSRQFMPDGMSVKHQADIPMAAMWMLMPRLQSQNQYVSDIMESASDAHLYGKKFVAAESFTVEGYHQLAWSYTPEKIKPTADLEMYSGVTRFVVHESAHQPLDTLRPGLTLAIYGQWFNRHETWAEEARVWTDYLARSTYMLSQGHYVADILYYYGEDNCVTGLYGRKLPDIPAGYSFDYVNPDALCSIISADGKRLVTPSGMSYAVLALGSNTRLMSLRVLESIARLAQAGAVIVGPRPEACASLGDDTVKFNQLVKTVWDSSRKNVLEHSTIAEALAAAGIQPDIETNGADSLLFVHRTMPGTEIYWINNRSGKWRTVNVSLRINGMKPQIWHAEDGSVDAPKFSDNGTRTAITLNLNPHDAQFIVLSRTGESNAAVTPQPTTDTVATYALTPTGDATFHSAAVEPDFTAAATLGDWSKSSDRRVKYFSGTAKYTFVVKIPKKKVRNCRYAKLDLGEVKNLARVVVNGKEVRTLWKTPFWVNIAEYLQGGNNKIEVFTTNTWPNRIIGDCQSDVKVHKTTRKFYAADTPLFASGLMGPVSLTLTK